MNLSKTMKTASALYKLILLAFIAAALYLEIFRDGAVVAGAFYYFTIQSNILAALCLLYFAVFPSESRKKSMFRGTCLLAVTVTGIVYNTVLYKLFLDWGGPGYTLSRTVTHLIAPIGFILDWLLFDRHWLMKYRHIPIWMVYPLAYCVFAFYEAFRSQNYLYFFFDVSAGYLATAKWMGIFLLMLLAAGAFFVFTEKLIGRIIKY